MNTIFLKKRIFIYLLICYYFFIKGADREEFFWDLVLKTICDYA